ncbi:MAG TPA: RnfH family protein [Burkholderiales bacterium]|nr:RnfH family protein [Burkholderiales bacterium]
MSGGRLVVEVVYPLPERQGIVTLDLPAGSTVRDALAAYRDRSGQPMSPDIEHAAVARYGHVIDRNDPVKDGDRLDILRPLTVDPKDARRRRAALHGRAKPKR